MELNKAYMENAFDLIKWAEAKLERSHIPTAGQNAMTLFTHSFNLRREDLYLKTDFKPRADHLDRFKQNVTLRAARFPMQYITNNVEFFGMPFLLEKGVFIPRPETELLVEKVIDHIKASGKKAVNILDMGTGCGNIAISLTKNVADCKIMASDISKIALEVASGNAGINKARKRVKFIQSSYFTKISPVYHNYFDVVASNPPYIRSAEIGRLQPELAYEDVRALDGGEDGLHAYRRILRDGTRFLKKGGIFAFEIGYDQAAAIEEIIKKDGRFSETSFYKDYNGHRRVLVTRNMRPKR